MNITKLYAQKLKEYNDWKLPKPTIVNTLVWDASRSIETLASTRCCILGESAVNNWICNPPTANPFITTFTTATAGEEIIIEISTINNNFIVDWGDSTSDTIVGNSSGQMSHTYATAGNFDVSITGTCPIWKAWSSWPSVKSKVSGVKQWGEIGLTTASRMFAFGVVLFSVDATDPFGAGITDFSEMFGNCWDLAHINVTNWDMSSATNLDYIFANNKFTTINVSNWDVSNVTIFRDVFNTCRLLTSLDVSNWDVSKGTDFHGMFGTSGLLSLDLSRWNTVSAVLLSDMFRGSSALHTVLVGNFNTQNVTNMEYMFYNCNSLLSLDISNFDTSRVINFAYIFYGCYVITSLDVSSWNTSLGENFESAFGNCKVIETIPIESWNVSKSTTFRGLFQTCEKLQYLNMVSWVYPLRIDFSYMFYNCSSLVCITNVTTANNKGAGSTMFSGCSSLVAPDSGEQTLIAGGSSWVNPGPCP